MRLAILRVFRARRSALGIGALVTALGFTAMWPPRPLLVWNASASAPIGLYWLRAPEPLARGDMVAARLPQMARALAAQRGYIPASVPLIKRVAAATGDQVCAEGGMIHINGAHVASRHVFDARGRAMPWWRGCLTLGPHAVFLLMDAPDSFDGRYFGPSDSSDILGRAQPLWLR